MTDTQTTFNYIRTFPLILLLMTSRLISNMPLLYTRIAGTSAPISALISGVIAVFFIFLMLFLFSGNSNIFNIERTTSKYLKIILGFILLFYLFLSASYQLVETAGFMKLLSFPESPLWFVSLFFIISAAFGALCGKRTLLRITSFVVSGFLFSLLTLVLSVLFQSTASNLFPILGNGFPQTFTGGLSGISLYSDIILLFLLKPELSASKSTYRTVIISATIAVLFTVLVVIAYTAKIPYPVSSREQYPVYLLLKEVYLGRFFQRIDAVFLLASAMNAMLTLSIQLYVVSEVFRRFFHITAPKATIFPSALLLFFSSTGVFHIPPSLIIWASYVIPGIFILVSLIPRKELPLQYEN